MVINKHLIEGLIEMLITIADIQGWTDEILADIPLIQAKLNEKDAEIADLQTQVAQLQEQLANVPTQEAAQQIIQPGLDGVHNLTQ